MNRSEKVFRNADQSSAEAKKPQKHDANLQKNSSLYFQIGLILCLLATYSLFEMQFQDQKVVIDTFESNELATIDVAPPFTIETITPDIPKPDLERSQKLIETYELVPDDQKVLETKLLTPDESAPEPKADVLTSLPDEPDLKEDDVFVDFIAVEIVPVYPGCDRYDTNEERKQCMSDQISKLVNRDFDTGIASEYGLSGIQKIYTQFTIDKYGNVVDVKARAPHPALEKEAQRIIDKIPHMKPGYQRDRPVGVIYSLPIKFKVHQ